MCCTSVAPDLHWNQPSCANNGIGSVLHFSNKPVTKKVICCKGMANYLIQHFHLVHNIAGQTGHISLNHILEGKTR